MTRIPGLILFDLDGTLVDSHEAIYDSAISILSNYSDQLPSKEVVFKSVGLPIAHLFQSFLDEPQLSKAVPEFRRHLRENGQIKTRLISGARSMLETLKNQNLRLVLVSNKQTALANSVLEQQGISEFFDFVVGSDLGRPKPSPDLINIALSKFPGVEHSAMVGDRVEDMEAAMQAGIKGIFLENSWNPKENLLALLPYKPIVISNLGGLFQAYLEIEEAINVE